MNIEKLYVSEFSKMQIDNADAEISDAVRQDLTPGNSIARNPDGTVTISREMVRRFRRWTNWRRVFRKFETLIFSLDLDQNTKQHIQSKINEFIEDETQDNGIKEPERFLINILRDEINHIQVASRKQI